MAGLNRVDGIRLSSCGNQFLLLPGQGGVTDLARSLPPELDGLLILEPGPFLRYFNRDGSEARVCGNGLRCAGYWLHLETGEAEVISTLAGRHRIRLQGDEVGVELPVSPGVRTSRIVLGHRAFVVQRVEVGVPHGVVWVKDLDRVDVELLGRAIRTHRRYKPEGINVDFAQPISSGLAVRTYERGVERETRSCGTGAAAAALVGYLSKGLTPPILCRFPGGELKVEFEFTSDGIRAAWVWGSVTVHRGG